MPKEYHGHRAVLARVPYFAAALGPGAFREGGKGRVTLEDLPPAAFDYIWRRALCGGCAGGTHSVSVH